jgi:hypothetical protein
MKRNAIGKFADVLGDCKAGLISSGQRPSSGQHRLLGVSLVDVNGVVRRRLAVVAFVVLLMLMLMRLLPVEIVIGVLRLE